MFSIAYASDKSGYLLDYFASSVWLNDSLNLKLEFKRSSHIAIEAVFLMCIESAKQNLEWLLTPQIPS